MLKIMEFALVGAAVLVIAGLVFAGPKSAPPPEEEPPLGAANPHQPSDEHEDKRTIPS